MSCSHSSLLLSIVIAMCADTDVLFVPASLATSTWHRVRAIILIVQDTE